MKIFGAILGTIILVITFLFSAYCLLLTDVNITRVVAFGGIAVLCGIGLILADRITVVKLLGLGEIQAATQKARTDAEQIGIIRKEVQDQKDVIESLGRDAKQAREQMHQLEEIINQAGLALERVQLISDFSFLLLQAANDDRKSFISLLEISESENHPFKTLAEQAVLRIIHDIDPYLNVRVDPPIPWHVNPEALSFEQLGGNYHNLRDPRLKPPFLSFIWKQERFSKFQKLDFLAYVIQTENSLRALQRVCRLMNQEAKLNLSVAAANEYVIWWEAHKHEFQQE